MAQQDTFASGMIGMLAWMQTDACPKLRFDPPLNSAEYQERINRLVAAPQMPPREDFAAEPSGRIAALRARADMLIRNADDDLKEANALEEAAEAERQSVEAA